MNDQTLGYVRAALKKVKAPRVAEYRKERYYEHEFVNPETDRIKRLRSDTLPRNDGRRWVYCTKEVSRDAAAIVLGVPVSFITLRKICRLASIPDTATVRAVDDARGARLLIRWVRREYRGPSEPALHGGFDLVRVPVDGPTALRSVTVL